MSDYNENWSLGVISCGEHDCTIEIVLWSRHIFTKWPPYRENVNFVQFQRKLISSGNLMCRTWWYYQICFSSYNSLPCSAYDCILLCFGGQVSDSGSWEPLVMSFYRFFFKFYIFKITQKRKQISQFRAILGCSAWKDLSSVQISWRSVRRHRSYCPFTVFLSSPGRRPFELLASLGVRRLCQKSFFTDLKL